MKSTRRRSDFTRRQANFTLHSNISPTRRVDFVEKSTSEEVLFSGAGGGTRFARLRALGRSRSQQSTGLLLCAARPSSPTHAFRINKKGTADAIPFFSGAGGGTRTHTMSPSTDFESVTSANSITPAYQLFYYSAPSGKNQEKVLHIVSKGSYLQIVNLNSGQYYVILWIAFKITVFGGVSNV